MRPLLRTLKMSLNALRRNVMRSALTTLGIVIGVAAVIAMTEIGQGTNTSVQTIINNMGANNLLVQPGTASSGGVSFGSGSVFTLTPQDADAIRELSSVAAVAPIVRARGQIIYGNQNWVPIYIYGTTPSFLGIRDWEDLAAGEAFSDRDVSGVARVCMLGQTIASKLFGDEDPVGKEIRVLNVTLKVIGVLRKKGANMMGIDQDDILLAPWTTIKYRISGSSVASVNQSAPTQATDTTQKVNTLNQQYPGSLANLYPLPSATQAADSPQPVRFTNVDQILVQAATSEDIPMAIDQISGLLRERHRIKTGMPEDFNVRNMTEMNNASASVTAMMTRALLFVAMVSLMVGGVGIMNIMLVSVTERTREIGLRMAVGARARDILLQFLTEAIVLCLMGGLLGIAFGLGAAYLVSIFLKWPTEHSLLAVFTAVGVSAFVGLVFGYYPAWKASKLDPIDALRYE